MNDQKKRLNDKLIFFQTQILDLNHELNEKQNNYELKENQFYSDLFDIIDNIERKLKKFKKLEHLKKIDLSKSDFFQTIQFIHTQLLRLLSKYEVEQIKCQNNMATMENCKVVEVKKSKKYDDGYILEIVKNGYINTETMHILKKMEVVTVRND